MENHGILLNQTCNPQKQTNGAVIDEGSQVTDVNLYFEATAVPVAQNTFDCRLKEKTEPIKV